MNGDAAALRNARALLRRECLIVAVIATAVTAALGALGLVERTSNLIYDQLLPLARAAPANDVAIVAIDEQSLSALGRWPWPRPTHAALLRRLAEARPRVVAYDVLFSEPGRGDEALARAMRTVPTVLPLAFSVPGDGGRAFDVQLPIPEIARAARALGQAAVLFDSDGIVRGAALWAGGGGARWPHVAERIHEVAYGKPAAAFRRAKPQALPASAFGLADPILVALPHGRVPTISFDAVLRGEVPGAVFRDKIVLVGMTAPGGGDSYPVANGGGAMSGVELLANVAAALHADRQIIPAPIPVSYAVACAATALCLFALLSLAPRTSMLLGLGALGTSVASAALLLRYGNVWLSPAPTLIALSVLWPLWGWRRLVATSKYMAQELARLDSEPNPLARGATLGLALGGDAVTRQIALLNRAVKRVRELGHFLDDSLQSLPDPILVLGDDGRVLLGNHAAQRLFAPQPVTGSSLATLFGSLEAEPPTPGFAAMPGEQEFHTKSGRIFVARNVARTSADQASSGWICRLTDITAIRTAERQREQALRLLTHDMRAPQASILALLDGGHGAAALPRIEKHARRTLRLADDFVQLARAENAAYADDLLDLASIVREASDELWDLAERKRVRIECRHEDREHLVRGDRSLLARAFANLLGNAVKHSPDGGVISCTIASPAGDLSGGAQPMVRCDVEDQGMGLPQDDPGKMFEAFRTGGATRAQRAEAGAGLGLAFVETVVRRHAGQLRAENRAEGGARLSVWLPLRLC